MGNCCCRTQVNHHTSPNLTQITTPEKPDDGNEISPPRKSVTKGHGGGEDGKLPEPAPDHRQHLGKVITPNLRMYTFSELKSATNNFRPDTVLGEGGFGTVFKGWVDARTLAPAKVGVGIPVAVKKSNPDSEQGLQEWQAEVKFLGKFSHPNLVRLLGYCWDDKQFLLVYEYMQKGNLENHLFKKVPEPLPWDVRINVAIGAARGLDFLHTSEKSVIYRDFKSSNILLDGDYNAKLSDFGLAKLGPVNGQSHVTTRIMGTFGYAAPEYVATGHLYVKSDVYGFGVVLLEMLTGLAALDSTRPPGQHNLVEWTRSSLSDKRKLKKIMDPKLGDRYPIKGALQAGQLILKCLEGDPKSRPAMNEVLATLEAISSIKEKASGAKPNAVTRSSRNRDEAAASSSSSSHRHHQRSPLQHRPTGAGRGNRAYQHSSKPSTRR